jgi:outer membrane immunogenic protein
MGGKEVRETNGVVMRRLVIAFALIMLASAAFAADFEIPTLRGSNSFVPAPPVYNRWDGVYFGAQAAYSNARADFGNEAKLVLSFLVPAPFGVPAQALANPIKLLANNTAGPNFGGFAGYNWQFDDVILGIEGTYNHVDLTAASTKVAVANLLVGGNQLPSIVQLHSSLHLVDYATIRGRGGWAIGSFLPYAMAGVAVGRANVSDSAAATINNCDPVIGFCGSATFTKNDLLSYGYMAGLGLDVMLTSFAFLRGEYEYVKLVHFGDRPVTVNSARGAIGFKF